MINLFNDFMSASLPMKGLFIVWAFTVVAFYSSLIVLLSNVFFTKLKKSI